MLGLLDVLAGLWMIVQVLGFGAKFREVDNKADTVICGVGMILGAYILLRLVSLHV